MKISNEEFVKAKMPKARAESHRTNGGERYWLIRDGRAYMPFSEGKTQAQAWKNAKIRLLELEKQSKND